MPYVTLYVPKADAEIIAAMKKAAPEFKFPDGETGLSLSAWTVRVWKDTLEAAGRWPVRQDWA